MADENIAINITDKVATTIAPKIDAIGQSAKDAQTALVGLQNQLNALQGAGNSLNNVGQAATTFANAVGGLQSQMSNLQSSISNLIAALGSLNTGLQTVNNTTNNTTNNITNLGNSAASSAQQFVIFGVALSQIKGYLTDFADGVLAVVQWRAALDRVTIGLQQVSGSTTAAAANQAFLTKTINDLGLETNAASTGFIRLAAATQGTVLQGQATQQIFTAISEAASVLHLSVDQTNRIFADFAKMASTGTINLTELQRQLGTVLPGALNIAADSIGVTSGEFTKMVSAGQIVADDFLPKFAAAIQQHFAGSVNDAANSAQSSLNRFSNAWTDLERTIAASTLGDLAAKALGGVTKAINAVTDAIKLQTEAAKNNSQSFIVTPEGQVVYTKTGAAPTPPASSTNLSSADLAKKQLQQQTANVNQFVTKGKDMTPAETLKKNLDEVKSEFDAATKGLSSSSDLYIQALQTYNDRVANLQTKAAAPGIKAAHKQFENELSAQITALEANGTAAKNLYNTQAADLATALANQQISQATYITQLGADKQAELQKLIVVAQQEADLASGKDQLAARVRYLNQVKDLQGQEVTAAANTQKQLAQLATQTTLQAQKIVAQLNLTGDNKDAQNNNALAGLTISSQQLSDLNQLQTIMKSVAAARNQFTQDATKSGTLGSAEYIKGLADINNAEQQQLSNEKGYFAQRDALQQQWQTGVQQGIQNIITNGQNVASQISSLVTQSFSSMNDALATFVTTGKLNFSSLVSSITQGLIKIQLQTAESSALQALFGGASGGGLLSTNTGVNIFGTKTYNGTASVGDGTGGFSSGGWTGNGSVTQPAGIVHGQEFVVKASAVKQPGALSLLNAMNSGKRGYASGGLVGTPANVQSSSSSGNGPQLNVQVVNNMSDKANVSVQQGQDSNGQPNLSVIIDQVEGELASRVKSGRGPLNKSIGQAYNLRQQPSRG